MENTGNVISIFVAKPASTSGVATPVEAEEAVTEKKTPSFGDVMRQNEENLDRIRRERLKANIAVLKSYRIKN